MLRFEAFQALLTHKKQQICSKPFGYERLNIQLTNELEPNNKNSTTNPIDKHILKGILSKSWKCGVKRNQKRGEKEEEEEEEPNNRTDAVFRQSLSGSFAWGLLKSNITV